MRINEPWWWYAFERSLPARLLQPVGQVWGRIADNRFRSGAGYRAKLPILCVGNFTAGGTGKTPVAIAVAGLLKEIGKTPVFLTRGYGGSLRAPHWVDQNRDPASLVGDEPLLLARAGPVMVSRARLAGVQQIEAREKLNDVIIMDDGLQNGAVHKSLALAVVDGRRGVGNGRVIPAGPLRAPLARQIEGVDAILINRPWSLLGDQQGDRQRLAPVLEGNRPVLSVSTMPEGDLAWIAGAPIVAYAGIGAPGRFFDLVNGLQGQVVARKVFPDHHRLTEREAFGLLELASAHRATLLTTEKDRVRLAGASGVYEELWHASRTVPIVITFDEADRRRLLVMIAAALEQHERLVIADRDAVRDSA